MLGIKTWVRPPQTLGKAAQRRQRAFEDKESVKWAQGLQQLVVLKQTCPQTQLVGISDREGDVYDVLAAERPSGVDWLIRAAWNRRVVHPEQYLWKSVMAAPIIGQTDLSLPATAHRSARTAQLTLRCLPVRLQPPRHRARTGLPTVQAWAIYALEDQPPAGVEPLEWLLLSSLPTQTVDEVLERLTWYARRWTIESWHRVLKSGCRVETRQFGQVDRFMRATALFAVISWRILYATLLARLDGDLLSCEVLLQPLEWQALYCRTQHTTQLPTAPPALTQAVLWIAQLGGYLNRRHDRPPGPTVLWRGFLALFEITEMYRLFHPLPASPPIIRKKLVGKP